jgi:hypothetical protein
MIFNATLFVNLSNKYLKDTYPNGVSIMAQKRIRNSSTGKYYKIRERTSLYGKKGEIMGLWHPDDDRKKKKTPPRDEKGRFKKVKKKEEKKKSFFARLFG